MSTRKEKTITFQPTEEVAELLGKAQRSNPRLNRTLFINEALRTYLTSFKGRWVAHLSPAHKKAA